MKERILEYMKRQKIELIVFSLVLILSVSLTSSCGATADVRFLETNQEAATLFGDKLVYFYSKYQDAEGLEKDNVERRVNSIRAWQDSCKVAVEAHQKK